MKTRIQLPASVYDALELTALVFGGIGSNCLADDRNGETVPSCVIGHALFLDGYDYSESSIVEGSSPVCDALVAAFPALADEVEAAQQSPYRCIIRGIEEENDTKVNQYAKSAHATLTWKQWCKRMRVVRGDN